MTTYLDATREAAMALIQRGIEGPVVMLNLLRFRDVADYSATPELAPAAPISGAAAYRLYMEQTLPVLEASGGRVLFTGDAGPFLIGPPDESWDFAMLVEQSSVMAFLGHAQDQAALAVLGHRTAAVADSRLLPLAPTGFAPSSIGPVG